MVFALIVAAGSGVRMRAAGNKLFLPLAGRPLICHTWGALDASDIIDRIIIVTKKEWFSEFQEMKDRYGFSDRCQWVEGGLERQDSVRNGLEAVNSADSSDIALIHDGARPFITAELIQKMAESAASFGAAVCASPVVDTIKSSSSGEKIDEHLDRSKLWAVQTPQAFQLGVIRNAIDAAHEKGLKLTDDTAACSLIGQQVRLIPWTQPNPKITHPGDLPYFEFLASQSDS